MGYAVICGTSQHSEIIDRSPALALYRAAYTGDMPQVAWDSFHNPSPRGAPPEGIDLTDHSEVAPAPSRANSGQGLPWKGTLATYSRKVAPLPSRDFAAEPAPEPDPTEAAGASSAASGRSGLVPWSIFQYLATSQRSLSGFQSWGIELLKILCMEPNRGVSWTASSRLWWTPMAPRPQLLYYPEPTEAQTPISPNFSFRVLCRGRVWGSTIIRVKDRQVHIVVRAFTTKPRTRCLLQSLWRKQNTLPTVWACGRDGCWDRRHRYLPRPMLRPKLPRRRHRPSLLLHPRVIQLGELRHRAHSRREGRDRPD